MSARVKFKKEEEAERPNRNRSPILKTATMPRKETKPDPEKQLMIKTKACQRYAIDCSDAMVPTILSFVWF